MTFQEITRILAEKYVLKTVSCIPSAHIEDIILYDNAQTNFDPAVLYFVFDDELVPGAPLPSMMICGESLGEIPGAGCCAAVPDNKLLGAYNYARRALQNSSGSLLEELRASADSSKSLEGLINFAASKLGDPIVFCDMEFRVVASSSTIPVVDPLWIDNIAKGYCSYDFIEGVKALESVKLADLSTDAHEVTCDLSPYRKLTSKVMSQGMQIGFVLLFGSETPITHAHFSMLKQVSEAITYAVRNYANYLLSGIDRYQQLIYSTLIDAPVETLRQLRSSLQLPERMVAVCLQPTRHLGDKHLKKVTCPSIGKTFPNGHAVCHEGCIALLHPVQSGTELTAEEVDALGRFADKNHMVCGISNSFTGVAAFKRHYRKAKEALKMTKSLDRSRLQKPVLYRDCILFDVLRMAGSKTELGDLCHPALQLLRENDNQAGGDLYNTLHCYVDNNGHMNDTAAQLFIHRNSLSYRMNRIRELTGLDPDDLAVRFALMLSFDIDRFLSMEQ